jgi:hypothetical protein
LDIFAAANGKAKILHLTNTVDISSNLFVNLRRPKKNEVWVCSSTQAAIRDKILETLTTLQCFSSQ